MHGLVTMRLGPLFPNLSYAIHVHFFLVIHGEDPDIMSNEIKSYLQLRSQLLGPYSTHATPILLLCAPLKPTTIIVVTLH